MRPSPEYCGGCGPDAKGFYNGSKRFKTVSDNSGETVYTYDADGHGNVTTLMDGTGGLIRRYAMVSASEVAPSMLSMLRQRKYVLLLLIFLIVGGLLLGWDLEPGMDPGVLWISEDPNVSFSWREVDGKDGHFGEFVTEGRVLSIAVGFRSDTMSVLCVKAEDEGLVDTVLFGGKCKFGISRLALSVTHDDAGLFGEDLPTIVFEKQRRTDDI